MSSDLEFLSADNLSRPFEPDDRWFDGSGRIPCGPDDREVTTIEDDMAVLDDGRLIVFVQGRRDGSASVADAAENGEWMTFTGAEYCVDRVSLLDNITRPGAAGTDGGGGGGNGTAAAATARGTNGTAAAMPTYAYVAWVCRSCSKITCVPKCCAKGFMLEYSKNKVVGCRKTPSAASADAAIRLRSANGTVMHRECHLTSPSIPPIRGDLSSVSTRDFEPRCRILRTFLVFFATARESRETKHIYC